MEERKKQQAEEQAAEEERKRKKAEQEAELEKQRSKIAEEERLAREEAERKAKEEEEKQKRIESAQKRLTIRKVNKTGALSAMFEQQMKERQTQGDQDKAAQQKLDGARQQLVKNLQVHENFTSSIT